MQSSKSTHPDQTCNCRNHNGGKYYSELAGITSWLFVGVLALMTFLLTVGLQHPQKWFSTFLYFSISLLPVGLIIYVVSHMVQESLHNVPDTEVKLAKTELDDEDTDDDKKTASDAPDKAAKSGSSKAVVNSRLSWLKALRMVQQIVFILSLVAVTGLALVSAHIFFSPPTAAPQTQQGQ